MEEKLKIINKLHKTCRKFMETENLLNDIMECGDMKFLSEKTDAMLEATRYILKEDLTHQQLNSNIFTDWFFQEDSSVQEIIEKLKGEK